MSIPTLLVTMSDRQLPPQVFFDPTDAFVRYLTAYANGRRIIDCGAGIGRLARRLADAGATVLAIDLMSRARTEHPIEINDAVSFRYRPDDLAVIARPCRGDWIESVIRNATHRGAEVVYITKVHNVPIHLSDEARASAQMLYTAAGADKELALAFNRPIPLPALHPGEKYVKLPHWTCAEPMYDGKDRWIGRSGSWFRKGGDEIVVAPLSDQHSVPKKSTLG